MNLPNSLTVLRIFFVPVLVVILLTRQPNWNFLGVPIHFEVWGVLILLIAAATDAADGYIARKRREITTLGILLDPIADKLLISAAFVPLVWMHLVPAWMVVIIVGREFAVSGLRSIASAEGFLLEPSELGKTKMVFQVVAITVIILGGRRFQALQPLGKFLLWAVVVFAVASAVQYFWGFWRRLDERVKHRASHHVVVMDTSEKEAEEKDVAAQ